MPLRGLVRTYFTVMAAALAVIAVTGVSYALPGLERLPQRVAVIALLLGLIAVLPLRFRGFGMRPLYGWLLRSPVVVGWIEGYRPFQFAAVWLVLAIAIAERTPAWARAAWARLQVDWATEAPGETIVAWTVLGLLVAGAAALGLAFGALLLHDALVRTPRASGDANLVVLWNVTSVAILCAAEVSDLFSGTPTAWDWRWWLSVTMALGVVRGTFVVTLLLAADWLYLPLDAALADKALDTNAPRWATVVALALVSGAFLWLEPRLGWLTAAALAVMSTWLLAPALERLG